MKVFRIVSAITQLFRLQNPTQSTQSSVSMAQLGYQDDASLAMQQLFAEYSVRLNALEQASISNTSKYRRLGKPLVSFTSLCIYFFGFATNLTMITCPGRNFHHTCPCLPCARKSKILCGSVCTDPDPFRLCTDPQRCHILVLLCW
jgi:hypothetical protein